jgi:hypothetical protein
MSETKTPAEWAEQVFTTNPRDRWKHAVAEQLHGWGAHEHHAGKPLQLTEADYQAALAAAEGGSEPHAGALSEYAPKPQEPDRKSAAAGDTERDSDELVNAPTEPSALVNRVDPFDPDEDDEGSV